MNSSIRKSTGFCLLIFLLAFGVSFETVAAKNGKGKENTEINNKPQKTIEKSRNERRKWTFKEDKELKGLVKKYGDKWKIIASHFSSRSAKQCREHYINQLDPNIIKGRLSQEEWKIVVTAQKELGNKWTEIAKLVPGRTPNQLKNYWHSPSRRREREAAKQVHEKIIVLEVSDDDEAEHDCGKILHPDREKVINSDENSFDKFGLLCEAAAFFEDPDYDPDTETKSESSDN